MRKVLEELCRALAYRFNDPAVLEDAITHRSAGSRNNERLEFLGDAILNFVIAEALFHQRPDLSEGDLSRLRASLVRGDTLATLALALDLGQCLRLGSGERKSGGFRRKSILADALEAVFGAVYIDGGFAAAREVITGLYADRLRNLPALSDLKDPKTRLQELLQSRRLGLPEYQLIDVSGDDHRQQFRVSCVVDAGHSWIGEGGTRRRAEQAAARRALEALAADE